MEPIEVPSAFAAPLEYLIQVEQHGGGKNKKQEDERNCFLVF
jgi:hypothetical protein